VQQAKDAIAQLGKDIPVIVKLEKPEALNVLDDVIRVADGMMVARGDLGVEMPLEQVPIAQKRIIQKAVEAAIPVITATQMLESMMHAPRPTRAEVSDVANAIIDGTSAVMLSEETATGEYPVEAVQMMARIAEEIEASRLGRHPVDKNPWLLSEEGSVPHAIGAAVNAIVRDLPVQAIWVFTLTGRGARIVAHYRPQVPILAFTPTEATYRRLSLIWGITPILTRYARSEEEHYQQILSTVHTYGLAQEGDMVVLTGGHPFTRSGPTNFLEIMRVPPFQRAPGV
jgi:pyruvate kinase